MCGLDLSKGMGKGMLLLQGTKLYLSKICSQYGQKERCSEDKFL